MGRSLAQWTLLGVEHHGSPFSACFIRPVPSSHAYCMSSACPWDILRPAKAHVLQDGAGWCAYDDIMLGVRKLRAASGGQIQRILYIDLDVHQVLALVTAGPFA